MLVVIIYPSIDSSFYYLDFVLGKYGMLRCDCDAGHVKNDFTV